MDADREARVEPARAMLEEIAALLLCSRVREDVGHVTQICVNQRYRRRGLGAWLDVNAEAIYGSRPWVVTESATGDGTPLRFTKSGEGVYALLLGMPRARQVTLRGVDGARVRRVRLVGVDALLEWSVEPGGDLSVTMPARLPLSPVTVLDLGTGVRARLERAE